MASGCSINDIAGDESRNPGMFPMFTILTHDNVLREINILRSIGRKRRVEH